ncbi:uracil-DNA glycosylase [Alkalicoccus luteus]|uniref:uracil-DNA glycosylase n=1 Tax=Alkalicoccus luteus TaxID=1237094 RepID=UPI0040341BBF
MRIPKSLAEEVIAASRDFPLEGFVYGNGPVKPAMMLVGEAPGETEIHNGVPFSGRAGKELMAFLEGLGLSREEVYITSAVRSRPYRWGKRNNRDGTVTERKYNRPPTQKEITAHAPILDYELSHVQAPVIVTLGNIGLRRLAGTDYKVGDCHGRFIRSPVRRLQDGAFVWSDRDYLLFPTFHPAAIFYNRSLQEKIAEDQEKLRHFLKTGVSS